MWEVTQKQVFGFVLNQFPPTASEISQKVSKEAPLEEPGANALSNQTKTTWMSVGIILGQES
jgi:hypothetical protein